MEAISEKLVVEVTEREEFENNFYSCISQARNIIQNNKSQCIEQIDNI